MAGLTHHTGAGALSAGDGAGTAGSNTGDGRAAKGAVVSAGAGDTAAGGIHGVEASVGTGADDDDVGSSGTQLRMQAQPFWMRTQALSLIYRGSSSRPGASGDQSGRELPCRFLILSKVAHI